MPEGLPDELWTNYRTFFWDNGTGLYFGLGFITLILGGFVLLCKRAFGSKSGKIKVSKDQRRSINNPVYIMSREEVTSRDVLVGAEAGTDGYEGNNSDLEIEEEKEEPIVIYENEQFFRVTKQTMTSDVEDVIGTEGRRNCQPRYAYSQVIKKSKERARKKQGDREPHGAGERSKGKNWDVYSESKKNENEKSKPKTETDNVPGVPKKTFEETKASEMATEEDDDGICEERRETDRDNKNEESRADDRTSTDGNPDDYVNVTAPRILSLGDEEYLDMSQREQEADSDDYINYTNIKNPS